MFGWFKRHKARKAREVEIKQIDAHIEEQIESLRERGRLVESFLVPRQRRNHWQEAVAEMIRSGGHTQ